jgi:hypothetical protein
MALDLGPCQVLFGASGSEVDIGKTQGGVRVTFSQDEADLLSDQYGTQPEDQVITGHTAMIVVPMADYSIANLATALHQTRRQLGAQEGIKGSSLVGSKQTTYGNSLLLKKYVDGAVSADENNWIRFPNAAPSEWFIILVQGGNSDVNKKS